MAGPGAKAIGRKVRQYREASGLSLSEVARISGVSRSYLYQVESGLNSPTGEKIQALANAFGVKVSDLLGAEDEAPEVPESLARFADRVSLPSADLELLARISYRGKQPATPEGWQALFAVVKALCEAEPSRDPAPKSVSRKNEG